MPEVTPETAAEQAEPPARRRAVSGPIWLLEYAQDLITIVVGIVLIALAATIIISGAVSFFHGVHTHSVAKSAINLLDQVLLVLILVEIVHTVVLSLRTHRLVAQPFIIVGLVAVIRRILFLLSNEQSVNTTELALLIGMLVAFVAGLVAVSFFEPREELDSRPQGSAAGKRGGH